MTKRTTPAGISDTSTVAEARVAVDREARTNLNGVFCPVCDGVVNVYRRTFGHRQMNFLHYLAWAEKKRIVATTQGFSEWRIERGRNNALGGDHAKIALWNLGVEDKGVWRMTELGRLFMGGRSSIPRQVLVYKGAVIYTEGGDVSRTDALAHAKAFKLDDILVILPPPPPGFP